MGQSFAGWKIVYADYGLPLTKNQRRASVVLFVVCMLATVAASLSISMDLRRILEPFILSASQTSVNNATQRSRKYHFKNPNSSRCQDTQNKQTNRKNSCVSFFNQSQRRNYSDAWWHQSFHLWWSKGRPNKIQHNFAYFLCSAYARCQSWSKQNWYYMEFGRCLSFAVTCRRHDRDDSIKPFNLNTLVNSCADALIAAHASCCLRSLSWRIFRIFTIFNGLLLFECSRFDLFVISIILFVMLRNFSWIDEIVRMNVYTLSTMHLSQQCMELIQECADDVQLRLVVKNWNTKNACFA